MWLESEINRLRSLYANLKQFDINEVLPTKELEVISDLSTYELENINNKLLVPKVYQYNVIKITFD